MPIAPRCFTAITLLLLALGPRDTPAAGPTPAPEPHVNAAASAEADAGLTSGELFDALARMDEAMFHASFVACDAEKANAIFAEDVEFYHDQTGFAAGEQVRENTRRLTASCPGRNGVTRSVVAGSLRVYPIHDYGAAQMGTHRFDERGSNSSTLARFVSLWRLQDGRWRLTRVLSLDHRSVPAGTDPPAAAASASERRGKERHPLAADAPR